jgi:hypothetical protein
VLSVFKSILGIQVDPDPSLESVQGTLDLRVDQMTRREATQALEKALREQLNIVVERTPEGKMTAKLGPAR